MNRLFFGILSVLFIGLFILPDLTRAEGIEKSPRALVHLLEYLANDYAGAVQNGKILSKPEYEEQLEFVHYAFETAQQLRRLEPSYSEIASSVAELRGFIQARADAAKVNTLALSIKSKVLKVSQIAVAPKHWPNLQNGRRIFEAQCSTCHGATGHGDGPSGSGMNPPPRNFHDPEIMSGLTAFHVYNVTKLGIPGTGMIPFAHLTEDEAWDVSFFTLSLRHQNSSKPISKESAASIQGSVLSISLEEVTGSSDRDLATKFQPSEAADAVAALRLKDGASEHFNTIPIARAKIETALKLYAESKVPEARHQALMAYLDGVEPVEPKLRAADADLVTELELIMAQFRSTIESQQSLDEARAISVRANAILTKAEEMLMKQESSPWLSFTLAAGIVFREGFEAILMILAILGVVRAAKAKRAALFVHSGWISAIGLGIIAWFFSGFLIQMSGAQREVTEGFTSLFAVVVLLYMGFWLHQRTEIKRWTAFIDGKVKAALEGSRRWTLFLLAFVAVFREAFETVLFMRAIYLEGGASSKTALFSGALISLVFTIFMGWTLLKFSLKLPIRQLFAVSSWIMMILAVMLVGKGVHSLQEAGWLNATTIPMFNFPFFGIFPTFQSSLAQAVTLILCVGIMTWSTRSGARSKSV